jgi:predicted transglutaminase-like protease
MLLIISLRFINVLYETFILIETMKKILKIFLTCIFPLSIITGLPELHAQIMEKDSVAITYAFGSKFANIVNTRF